jgi:membrane-bound lytic murein transglycosylase D
MTVAVQPTRAFPAQAVPEPADISFVSEESAWRQRIALRPAPSGSAAMIPVLKKAFAAEGVPPEWVWMAEVESSMDPDATSPSGAVGLFQFMPDTARRFGLRTSFGDERTDPRKSARAAARYLKVLHAQFGSWPLVLAAYNAGEGYLSRLLKKHRANSFDEIAVRLPLETQMYVPKVLATVHMREGVDPERLPPPIEDQPKGS